MPKTKTDTSKDGRMSRPTFTERVNQAAKALEDEAWHMPPGPERDHLLRRAREMETASHMQEWLASHGPSPPK
jgi:hypothetical protein